MKRILLALLFAVPLAALAQSNPGLQYGQVPTAAQWNSFFSAKQDVGTIGSGTVTNTSSIMTSNQLLIGNGGNDIKPLGAFGTTVSVLIGNAAGPPSFGTVPLGALPSQVALLTVAGQVVSGGATVTSANLGTISTGSLTINCGTVPLQYFTNGGAFTLTAPGADSSCTVLMTNNASAGTVSFSGFSVGAATGDALTTTNGNKFSFFIWKINGIAGYRVAAHQ